MTTATNAIQRLQTARINGVDIEYEVRGSGEPVLLIHGSHIGASFVTLMSQHVLTDGYQLIRYHRRGFHGSSPPPPGRFSIADQAADARALLEYLKVGPAHVVGHSYGGVIALQLAVDAPEAVATLALFEAALLHVDGGQEVFDLVDIASDLYREGDWEAAADLFLGSPRERADIARNVPGGLDQALRDVDTYFSVEAPAHQEWTFTDEDGGKVRCPVLFLLGAESSQLYRNAYLQMKAWAPQTQTAILPGASHLLHIQQPAGAASLLASFLLGHPILRPGRPGSSSGRASGTGTGIASKRYNATTDILEGNLEAGRGDKMALRTGSRDWTYAEVCEGANRVGSMLRELGVEIENRVLLAATDSIEFVTTFFGAIKIGAIPIPVNTNLTLDQYAYLLDNSRAKVVVVSEALADTMRRACAGARYLRHLVVVGSPQEGELSFRDLVDAADPTLTPADTVEDDGAFWLASIGPSGRPRAVMHLQRAMRACVNTYGRAVLALRESDVCFSVSRLYFAYGLGGGLYLPFAAGATSILTREPPQTRTVLHIAREFKPSVLFGVPTSYANILASGRQLKGGDFASVRLCLSAGEPLGPALLTSWREHTGVDIVEGIGSTESCHIYISNRAADVRPGSTGRLVEGYQARVVDDQMVDVPVGVPGRLLVSGESFFSGYWQRRELTRRALQGAWFDSGDMYTVDEEGYFTFQGRLDDMLKVGGMWVSPVEVEAVIRDTGRVADVAVVGVHDAINLVRLVALVVPRAPTDDHAETEAILRKEVRAKLGGNKTPRLFRFVPSLPRIENGDLQRATLPELARAQQDDARAAGPDGDPLPPAAAPG